MMQKSKLTLVNPQTGNLAFKIYDIDTLQAFDHIQRLNYYALIWVKKGKGTLKADFSEYKFTANTLMCFSPYQPFMIMSDSEEVKVTIIHFHPDFFCIHKHQKEVACNGVLFNNIYCPPVMEVKEPVSNKLEMFMEQIKNELQSDALAQYESIISYLKLFLITASREKTQQSLSAYSQKEAQNEEPFILQNLKDSIEEHYKTKHSASDYARMLTISTKSLGKLTKKHFDKTITNLIAERIVIEAKRELYLTDKTIKEIAYELGYSDEYYFSRFFKKNVEISPQMYRETVGFNRLATGR
ncbi:helix-turn-helix domain-containing protein [Zhouia amylolytica]|uniref:AraC family transcriptional regulator n=1 Tax=Zhouia amylolytica AD3 TaxID=1286632 RepID=W2UKX5_9FLAO|nr:helix-turn-helix domain-containing protein [Zhouia amylolytica]ETN94644.1 AraC family transcriptional regulator [Zhouia amylolytica AD3]